MTEKMPATKPRRPRAAQPATLDADQLRKLLDISETDLRKTRALLQDSRAEITLLRKTLAELHAHAKQPWWIRMFNSRQWWT